MGWSELPPDLLATIAGTLTEFTDHIRFRSVCSRWRSALRSLPLPPQLPFLLLPSNYPSRFYSFSEDRIYPVRTSDDSTISFLLGSVSGWLLALKGQIHGVFTVSVVNPFTGASADLPESNMLRCTYPGGADALVWDRSASIAAVGSTYRRGVFYCCIGKPHDWKQIESLRTINAVSVTFHKSKLYVMNSSILHQTFILDETTLEKLLVINSPLFRSYTTPHLFVNSPLFRSYTTLHLFVSSEESLLLLKSDKASQNSGSPVYKVYHMDLKKEVKKWRKVKDIGDRAIFLDKIRCFSVEVGDERSKVRRNCIYTAVEGNNRIYSVSVFDLGKREPAKLDGEVSKFRVEGELEFGEVSPTWIMPSFR
ncbi:hypothetical protein LUZ60_009165 [Juncus effusus]|nr:hypothetical protein LUZ60_009165 [Juncus effusus]